MFTVNQITGEKIWVKLNIFVTEGERSQISLTMSWLLNLERCESEA